MFSKITRKEFHKAWLPVFGEVFGDSGAWEAGCPPHREGWSYLPMLREITALPGPLYPHHDDYSQTVDEAKGLYETLDRFERKSICLTWEGHAWLMSLGELAIGDHPLIPDPTGAYFLFDQVADWGVMCDTDEGISIVGGEAPFMREYLKQAGGEAALYKRFVDYDLGQNWISCDPWSPAYRENLYRTFGWTAEPRPNKGEIFERQPDPAEWTDMWRPTLTRILGEGGTCRDAAIPPHWKSIPFRGHALVEGGDEAEDGYGIRPRLEEYNALLFVLTGEGRWETAVHVCETDAALPPLYVIPPWVRALRIRPLAGRTVALFDVQADWLLISFGEGGSFLAGEPRFVQRVVDHAGGEDAMQARFDAWAAEADAPAEVRDAVRRRCTRPSAE